MILLSWDTISGAVFPSQYVAQLTRYLIALTGGAPKIARGQKLVVGEPRPSASLLVKFWLPEFFF